MIQILKPDFGLSFALIGKIQKKINDFERGTGILIHIPRRRDKKSTCCQADAFEN
jgi:hypothetical protein